MTSTAVAIDVRNIGKRYGRTQALADVSLVVPTGHIHGLVGRNGAGKSTLIRAITGSENPDSGEIRYFGEAAPPVSARSQWGRLVGTVMQRAPLLEGMTIAENLFLNRFPTNTIGAISWRRLIRDTSAVLEEWGIKALPTQRLSEVSVEGRGLLQIARVLSSGSRIILLDEPTVQLDRHATQRLYDHVRHLAHQGITFVFVSHFLQEVTELCDGATVLRDGKVLWTRPAADISQRDLVDAVLAGTTATVGRVSSVKPASTAPALTVTNLNDRDGKFQDVSFTVRPGEIVALAGLAGSGKTEIGQALTGERPPASGSIAIASQQIKVGSVRQSQAAGIAFVPPDRHLSGYVPNLNVAENVTMSVPMKITRGGLIRPRARSRQAQRLVDAVSLSPARPDLLVSGLSGGNQQKVVFARALAIDPRVLVLNSPTAGVDISAKNVIYGLVERELKKGVAVVLVSDDVDELQVADRVVVMVRGRIQLELLNPSEAELVQAMEGMDSEKS